MERLSRHEYDKIVSSGEFLVVVVGRNFGTWSMMWQVQTQTLKDTTYYITDRVGVIQTLSLLHKASRTWIMATLVDDTNILFQSSR